MKETATVEEIVHAIHTIADNRDQLTVLKDMLIKEENPHQKLLGSLIKDKEMQLSYLELLENLQDQARGNSSSSLKKYPIGQVIELESLLQSLPSSINELPRLIIRRGRKNDKNEHIGCKPLREQDKTIDFFLLEDPHIQADAWDVGTAQHAKDLSFDGFSALIFERIGSVPLNWSAYLRILCTRANNTFYQLPESSLVEPLYMNAKEHRSVLKYLYDKK